jgi:hypothetical protein
MEIVYSDSSAEVAIADAPKPGGHDVIDCLSNRYLSSYKFISVTSQGGFIPVSLKPIDDRLNIFM